MHRKDYYTQQQISTLMLHLAKGECPVKYSYLNPIGAKKWCTIEEQNTTYKDDEIAVHMIEPYIQELGNPKSFVIFDFGCGNGQSIIPLLRTLQTKGKEIYYHAFDMSAIIIETCKKNITTECATIKFSATLIDFETTNLVDALYEARELYDNMPVLGTVFGNTIGNFSSIHRTLSNIMDAMRINDRLAIGIQKSHINDRRRIESTIEVYKDKVIFDMVFSTLKIIGLDENSGTYSVEFDQHNNINGYFVCSKPSTIEVNKTKIHFAIGERIRILKSTKLNELALSQIFHDLDYRAVSTKSSLDDKYLQAYVANKKI